ncbi:GDSL-type esterase/lipase family protein [Rathayibacter sp. YIM 133350]|uniref:GDSL-type esterase/lipase family protein n=1 Tax=Rathayibacter sp. YIM 133350 TaxID=3131992 RepID=UPI00307E5E2E
MPGTIVFVGDSLTEAGQWDEWLPEENVINQGVGGQRTDDVIERLDEVVAAEPDAVVLLVGTNDLAWRKPKEEVGRNLETILVELRKRIPGVRLLVVSLLPREQDYAADIRDLNRHIRQFVATVHGQFLDLWPALADEDGQLREDLGEDRLHLNAAGYEAWVAELKPALETLFSTPPTTRSIPIVSA